MVYCLLSSDDQKTKEDDLPMTNDEQQSIVLHFNECINSRDIQGLASLMTDDHRFIDVANQSVQGKQKVVEA